MLKDEGKEWRIQEKERGVDDGAPWKDLRSVQGVKGKEVKEPDKGVDERYG